MPWKHIWAVEVQLPPFLTSALDTGGQLNAPVALFPMNRSMDGTQGCYGRSGEKTNLWDLPVTEPQAVQPVAYNYWTTLAPLQLIKSWFNTISQSTLRRLLTPKSAGRWARMSPSTVSDRWQMLIYIYIHIYTRARQRMEQMNWKIPNALCHNNQPITVTVEFQILRCWYRALWHNDYNVNPTKCTPATI